MYMARDIKRSLKHIGIVVVLLLLCCAGYMISILSMMGKGQSIGWSDVPYETLSEMEEDAELIVSGTPIRLRQKRINGLYATLVTIQVDAVYKGEAEAKELVVLQYGNRFIAPPSELPLMEKGKQYLLYLSPRPQVGITTCYRIAGGYQGIAVREEEKWLAFSNTRHTLFPLN